jgi:uroporphyrinogen III methyltransferase/synthase
VIRASSRCEAEPGSKQAKQSAIEAELVALAREGKSVVRLKGGDPFLFGRGSEEAEALRAGGVPFEVVSGVCSPLGAAAYAGLSLTHRDLASSVTFVSGTTRAGKAFDWSELANVRGTVCVLMGMRNLDEVARGLVEQAGRDPATPAAVVSHGTYAAQRVVVDRLDAIAARVRAERLESPGLVVVGEVVRMRDALRWFDARPLFGKRVLVTRPKDQIAPTARLLRLRGAEALPFPTIELVAPPEPTRVADAVRALGTYDVVAFTSENGVEWLWREIDAQRRDARAFGGARLAAIGTGTAAALAKRGVRADVVPGEFVGEGLARAILEDLAAHGPKDRPARVLVPRALVAREVLPDLLRKEGVVVDVVPVYETRPADPARRADLAAMFEAGRVDVVLLTSSSTADSLVELLGPRAAEVTARVTIASIGPITTATAEKRGLSVAVTAEVSTTAGLVEAVERHLARA